jgi:hypothetical protein
MENSEFEKYLNERYYVQIDWYDKRAIYNQKTSQIFQWIIIILAAATPVLITIGGSWEHWVAVVISFLVAVGTASLKTFKYQENWINYRTTCETLRKEIHFYNSGVGEYKDTDDREALFVERVEALISRENTMWLTTRRSKSEKGD